MHNHIRYSMHPRQALVGFVTLLALLVTCGCQHQQMAAQITGFDEAVAAGAEAISAYYTGLNDQEYALYFELLEIDPQFEVGDRIKFTLVAANGDREDAFIDSPLKQPPFPMESIQARIRLLKQLTEYSRNLAALAGAESPSQFQANVSTLKDRLISLDGALRKLADKGEDKDAEKYIGPLSTIVGIVGKWSLDERRWREIRASVIEAELPINALLDGVAKDLDSYVDPVLDLAAEDRYTTAIVYYNLRRKDLTSEQRTRMLQEIRDYKVAYDAARLQKPSSVVLQLKKAHAQLVKVAKSDRAPRDVAALNAELALFKDDVDQLKSAVRAMFGGKETTK